MLRPVTNITISQNGAGRNLVLFFDFVTSWEFSNNWEDLSAKGKVVFPKNIYVTEQTTLKRYPLFGVNNNSNIGGFNSEPLIKRGDKIKIEAKYIFWDENLNEYETKMTAIVEGYISAVKAGLPVEIELEDNMYLLKKTPMPNRSYKSTQTIESILSDALKSVNSKYQTNFRVNNDSQTNVTWSAGLLTSENETIAQFLAKLKRDARLFTYFRGDELRVGRTVYVESEAQTKYFEFQNNIISADLEYKRKDDIVLSAVASNHIEETVGTTKDGKEKKRKKRIEVLVTFANGADTPTWKEVKQGDKPDPNTDGERRTFTFPDATSIADLVEKTTALLKKYYYTGFKGKFTTFGTPYVQFGDNAQLINKKLPEQDGIYKIKGVAYSGGVEGYRQEIELDYKLNV